MEEEKKIEACFKALKSDAVKKAGKQINQLFRSIEKSSKRSQELFELFEDEASSVVIQGKTRKRARSFSYKTKRNSSVRSNNSTPRKSPQETPQSTDCIIPSEEVSPLAGDPSTPVFKKVRISPYEKSHQINDRHRKEIQRLSLSSSSSYNTPETDVKNMKGPDFMAHLLRNGTSKMQTKRANKLRKLKRANPKWTESELDKLMMKYPEHIAMKIHKEDLKIRENEFEEIDVESNNKKFESLSKKLEAWEHSPVDEPPCKRRKLSPEDERKTV